MGGKGESGGRWEKRWTAAVGGVATQRKKKERTNRIPRRHCSLLSLDSSLTACFLIRYLKVDSW